MSSKVMDKTLDEKLKGKIVLITGASSGIGEKTAEVLASQGAIVFMGARREERLKKLADRINASDGTAYYQRLDVSDVTSMNCFVQLALEKCSRIDFLINNAGIMLLGPVHDLKTNEWNRMISVNLIGVLNGVAAVLPTMKKQHSGMIINTSSTAAYRVSAGSAVYSATKYAVRAFSDALRKEETNNGIRVCLVAPGPTKTELLTHDTDQASRTSLTQYVDESGLDSYDVARSIAYVMSMPPSASVDELIISPSRKM